jgi:hypothetical protein
VSRKRGRRNRERQRQAGGDRAHQRATATVVMIATPAYGGMVTHHYANALATTTAALADRGVGIILPARQSGSLIQMNRNLLTAELLASPIATHMMWIDADIGWEAEDVLRLLAHDVDVICGLYPMKGTELRFPAGLELPQPVHGPEGLERVRLTHGPAGFMLVKRGVYLRLIEHYPEARRLNPEGVLPREFWPFYFNLYPTVSMATGEPVSEDIGFCERWRSLGGDVWLDPSIRLVHYGIHGWTGCVLDTLVIRTGERAAGAA